MRNDGIFINRELSWLDFNKRVLDLSREPNVPLAERLKFLAIYGSNLDEFFMVRVGSLYDQTLLTTKKEKPENKTHMTPTQQLAAIMPKVASLQTDCDTDYQLLLKELRAQGYHKIDFSRLEKEDERFWKKYFQKELYPVLSPQIVDNRHPFPFLRNKEIYLGVTLKSKRGGTSLGMIPISSQFDRMLFWEKDHVLYFGLVEELISHFAGLVFPNSAITGRCLFRVTRNADITVEEGMMDHDVDYREVMSELLKKRRKLAAVRIQFFETAPAEIQKLLCGKLILPEHQCFVQKCPLDLGFLFQLYSRIVKDGRAELCYAPARPMPAPAGYDLTEAVSRGDVLLAYPYQSIRPFITMLQKAARDPDVVSIKMTLYRMANESQIVRALMDAAENGKEVVALVELRARFDEQHNIDWSKQLEQAGCTVIYGFAEYKVHSKLTLITRKKGGKFSYITQIGTGNYNEKTSELYTDLSYITSDPAVGEEASAVFQNLSVQKLTENGERMLVAPLRFKSVILQELDACIAAAGQGKPVRVILKNNSISDRDIILKLAQASQAGVQVEMIVRGICCVRAQVPGMTDNLTVRSLVGRYLEHARIYSFAIDGQTHMYIASGDFLTRNTECRVEVGVQIRDERLVKRLTEILELQLADTVNASVMRADGSYVKVLPPQNQDAVDSQMQMYTLLKDAFAPSAVAQTLPEEVPSAPQTPSGLRGWLMRLISQIKK